VIGGRIFDDTALVGFALGSSVYVRALVWATVEEGVVLAVPAAALARAWAQLAPVDRAALDVLLDLPNTVIENLTRTAACDVGALLAAAPTADIATGQAVDAARRRGWAVVTAAAPAARRLDPDVPVEELP
jgi:hypothetical protein